MNIIKSDLINFKQLLTDIDVDKENIQPELFNVINTKLEIIFNKIKNPNEVVIGSIQKEVAKLLTEVQQELIKFPQKKTIQKLSQQIQQIQALVKQTPIALPLKLEKPKIDVHMGFVCDIDVPDTNGAITNDLILFLNQNSPFMTTRSMLKGMGLSERSTDKKFELTKKLAENLFNNHMRWEIYELSDQSSGNNLLVFLPVTLLSCKTEIEKLDSLDLKSDGSLKKISAQEAFRIPEGKTTIDTVFKFFSEKPVHNKLFIISGHGRGPIIAGLNKDSFLKWLDFITKQHCKGLTVESCYAGGESSLLALYKQKEEDVEVNDMENFPRELPFSMIVRSIGDFPTRSGQEGETNKELYFKELALFLEGTVESTDQQFRKTVEKVEGNFPKNPSNRIKVYFPHKGDSPGGYRSLGEHGLGYPLTYAKLRGLQLQHQLTEKSLKNETKILDVSNAHYLDIHPLVVDTPIRFKGEDPKLISMIPGKAHHFLRAIELSGSSPDQFMKAHYVYYLTHGISVPKAFFISELKSAKTSYNEVVMYVSPDWCYSVYEREGKYYLNAGDTTSRLTPLLHAILLRHAEAETLPAKAAVRSSSGGQEKQVDVAEILRSDRFGVSGPLSSRFYLQSETFLKLHPEEVVNFAKSIRCLSAEAYHLCYLLLDYRREDSALAIFKQHKLKPDQVNLFNIPLLSYAINKGQYQFATYLIEQNADVNAKDFSGDTPLHSAIASGNREMVELLLKHPRIKVNLENNRGVLPIFRAFSNYPEFFQLLKLKGANLNQINRHGETLLSREVYLNVAHVDTLLDEDIDPNLGSPSALTSAVQKNDVGLVKKMLLKGGKPFEPDAKGCVPFIEAILHGSPDLVDIFLSLKDLKLDVKDKTGTVPLIAAYFDGDPKKIQSLLNKGFTLTSTILNSNELYFSHYIQRCIILGEVDKLKSLLSLNPAPDVKEKIQHFLVLNLLNQDIDMLISLVKDEYISSGLINLETMKARKNPKETPGQLRNLLIMCIDKGLSASEALDFEVETEWLITYLIETGKLNSPASQGAMFYAINRGNLELIDLLLEKGCTLSQDIFINQCLIKKAYKIGKLPFMEKMLHLAKKWDIALEAMTSEEKRDLWHSVMKNEDKAAIAQLLSAGISPIFNQKNYLLKNLDEVNPDFLLSLIEGNIIQSSQLTHAELELIVNDVVRRGSPEVIKKVVQQLSVDLNTLLEDERCTVFQKILTREDKDLIEWCLEQGAQVNLPNQEGLLPIFAMLLEGNRDLVELLFQKGATLATLKVQQEAFYYALKSKKPEMVEILLSKGNKLSADFFKDRQFILESAHGGVPMMDKILQLAKQFQFDLSSLEDEEKKQLWKKVLNQKTEKAKNQALLLLKYGVSPMVYEKNVIDKWLKKNPNEEEILKPYLSKIEE